MTIAGLLHRKLRPRNLGAGIQEANPLMALCPPSAAFETNGHHVLDISVQWRQRPQRFEDRRRVNVGVKGLQIIANFQSWYACHGSLLPGLPRPAP